MSIIKIDNKNNNIYYNLSQVYEAEFASLTGELPDKNGLYKVQTEVVDTENTDGYLKYFEQIPIGFMVIKNLDRCFDVAEFFILPSFRRQKIGLKFAQDIILKHKGSWQIRQIQGADYATIFWRKVIINLVGHNYCESIENDSEWGEVTKQTFTV